MTYACISIDDIWNIRLWAQVADYASSKSIKTCFAPNLYPATEWHIRKQDYSLMNEFVSGHEICSHGLFHVTSFEKLHIEDLRRELVESKKVLEDNLGVKINTIVYPHGNYGPITIREAKAAGYLAGRTVRLSYSNGLISTTNPYAIDTLHAPAFFGKGNGTPDLESLLEGFLNRRELLVLLGHTSEQFSFYGWKRVIDYCIKRKVTFLTLFEIAELIRKSNVSVSSV